MPELSSSGSYVSFLGRDGDTDPCPSSANCILNCLGVGGCCGGCALRGCRDQAAAAAMPLPTSGQLPGVKHVSTVPYVVSVGCPKAAESSALSPGLCAGPKGAPKSRLRLQVFD